MKCPLFVMSYVMKVGDAPTHQADCIKEECAWWVKASESCAIEAIPRIIGFLGSELKGIKDKMPHEEQFRK